MPTLRFPPGSKFSFCKLVLKGDKVGYGYTSGAASDVKMSHSTARWRTFFSTEEAQVYFDEQLQTKLAAGYVVVAADRAPKAPKVKPPRVVDPAELSALQESLEALKGWLKDHGGAAIVAQLRPGVEEARLEGDIGGLGCPLPDDLRALYRSHDGETEQAGAGIFHHTPFLSLEEAAAERESAIVEELPYAIEDEDAPLKKKERTLRWWPLTFNENGSLIVNVDTGSVAWLFEGELKLAADSLADFLARYLERFRSGAIEVVVNNGVVELKGALPGQDEDT